MRRDLHRRLTLRQQRIAYEYIRTGNPKEAAINAGYSEYSASAIAYETLRLPHVEEFIKRTMKEAADKLGITPEYLLGKLKRGVELSLPEFEGDGEKHLTFDRLKELSDPKAAVSCISEMNRMLGHYAPEKSERESKIVGLDKLIDQCTHELKEHQ